MNQKLCNDLKQLILLQSIDTELDYLNDDYSAIPVEIENINKNISDLKEKFELEKKKLKEFTVKNKELELELATKEDAIRKHKTELYVIKTNEQYKALLNEIAKIEDEKSKIEDDILQLLETIDKQNQTITELEKKLSQEEVNAENSIRKLEEKKKELETEISTKQDERKKILGFISDSNVLRKYEHIRKVKEDGIAIAPIEDTNCGNCRIKLTPQIINEVSKRDKLIYCDNCSRILYLSELIEQSI